MAEHDSNYLANDQWTLGEAWTRFFSDCSFRASRQDLLKAGVTVWLSRALRAIFQWVPFFCRKQVRCMSHELTFVVKQNSTVTERKSVCLIS